MLADVLTGPGKLSKDGGNSESDDRQGCFVSSWLGYGPGSKRSRCIKLVSTTTDGAHTSSSVYDGLIEDDIACCRGQSETWMKILVHWPYAHSLHHSPAPGVPYEPLTVTIFGTLRIGMQVLVGARSGDGGTYIVAMFSSGGRCDLPDETGRPTH